MKYFKANLSKLLVLCFLIIWDVIFVVPPLANIAIGQMHSSIWPFSVFLSDCPIGCLPELAQQRHDDARVWVLLADEFYIAEPQGNKDDDDAPSLTVAKPGAVTLFPGAPSKNWDEEKIRRLDQIIEKFPSETWLLAKRLRLSWGYMYGDRVGGELSDTNLYQNQAAHKPSPERDTSQNTRPNYTPQELARVLALCKRGEKLEPQNAFYDWTKSYFLALSWRDQAAWSALDAAAKKPQWNDHRAEEVQAQIAARELQLNRPLMWEEKLRLSSTIMFPEFPRYREFARIVSWNSIKAQRKKDHATALRLAGSLAQVSAKMRDNSRYIIEGLVAVAMESIAVASPTYDARQAGNARRSRTTMGYAPSFQSYATQHGRKDLASWVARDATRATSFRGNSPAFYSTLFGVSFFQAALIGALWQTGVLLLLMLPFALYGWLILTALFRWKIARRFLLLDDPEPKIAKREIWNGALACGGLRAAGAALGVGAVLGLTWVSFLIGIGQGTDVWNALTAAWSSTVSSATSASGAPPIWESIAEGMLGFYGPSSQQNGRSGIVIGLIPILLGVLWSVSRARAWQETQRAKTTDAPRAPNSIGVLALLKALLTGQIFAHAMDFDLSAVGLILMRGFFFGAFCVAWSAVASWLQGGDGFGLIGLLIPMFLSLLFFALLVGEAVARWRRSTHRRSTARFGLRLLRESWLGWLALGSALFLLSLLIALPVRNRADAALDRVLQLGEIQALQTK